MTIRFGFAILLPLLALVFQWFTWPWISPFVWFLFFPAVFFSARLGGLWAGLISTVLSILLVWYFFIPPQLSWVVTNQPNIYSAGLFLVMGYLFSDMQEGLKKAKLRAESALSDAREANEQLTILYQRTRELDELKSQFFANISHELRTPLTLIMSPLAHRQQRPELSAADRRENEMMLRASRQLYRHINDLLDAAKLESGRMPMEYARVDLAGLGRAIASQFDSLAYEKEIDFRIHVPNLPLVEIDAEKTQRILINLLSNAFKFTPKGGHILFDMQQQDERIIVNVQDSGPGVPPEARELIFERFRQIDGGSQRRFGGTGLGLAIVKEFTELHRGHVSVQASPKGGAWFKVELPCLAPQECEVKSSTATLDALSETQQRIDELRLPASPHEDASKQSNSPPNEAPAILIVEDNIDMNNFIADTLRPHYNIVSAFNGYEGIKQALAVHPNLILCDLMMPEMSGERMVEELRHHVALADVPIVILSAKSDEALRIKLFQLGVQDYLSKPFAIDELLARIDTLIQKQQATRQTLHLSEQRFYDIVSASIDWIWESDAEGRLLYTSASVQRLLGYSSESLIGKTFFDLMPPAESTRMQALFQSLRVSLHPFRDVDYINYHLDGSQRYMQTSGQPILNTDGLLIGFRGIVRDMTEKKQAEESIRVSESRLQLALVVTDVGLWDWDVERDRAYLSPHYYEIVGYSPDQVTANFDFFKSTVYPDDLPRVLQEMEAHFQGKTSASEFDYRLVTRDGDIKWMRGRGRVVERDESGHPSRMIGTISDINHQKNIELELRHQAEELAAQNNELERFNRATIGRELDMIALKQQVNELSIQLGLTPPFQPIVSPPDELLIEDGLLSGTNEHMDDQYRRKTSP
jgi:PAS domain S-box-containing protein